jgi:hypothetical protein
LVRVTPGTGKTRAAAEALARAFWDVWQAGEARDRGDERWLNDGALWCVRTKAQQGEAVELLQAAVRAEGERRGQSPADLDEAAERIAVRPVRDGDTCGEHADWSARLRGSARAAEAFCKGCPRSKGCAHLAELRAFRARTRGTHAEGARIVVMTATAAQVDVGHQLEDGERVPWRWWGVVVDESPLDVVSPAHTLDAEVVRWLLTTRVETSRGHRALVEVCDEVGPVSPDRVVAAFDAWAAPDGSGEPPPARWEWSTVPDDERDDAEAEAVKAAAEAGTVDKVAEAGTAAALVRAVEREWKGVRAPRTTQDKPWSTTLPGPVRPLPRTWRKCPVVVLDATGQAAHAAVYTEALHPRREHDLDVSLEALRGGSPPERRAVEFIRIDAPMHAGSVIETVDGSTWARTIEDSAWERERWRTAHQLVDGRDAVHFTHKQHAESLAEHVRGGVTHYGAHRGTNRWEASPIVVLDAHQLPRHVGDARRWQYIEAGATEAEADEAVRGDAVAEVVQAVHRVRPVNEARRVVLVMPTTVAVEVCGELGGVRPVVLDADQLDRETWAGTGGTAGGALPYDAAPLLARWLVGALGGGATCTRDLPIRDYMGESRVRVAPPVGWLERAFGDRRQLATREWTQAGGTVVEVRSSLGGGARRVWCLREWDAARTRAHVVERLSQAGAAWVEWEGERTALVPCPMGQAAREWVEARTVAEVAAAHGEVPSVSALGRAVGRDRRTLQRWQAASKRTWAEVFADAWAELDDALREAAEAIAVELDEAVRGTAEAIAVELGTADVWRRVVTRDRQRALRAGTAAAVSRHHALRVELAHGGQAFGVAAYSVTVRAGA